MKRVLCSILCFAMLSLLCLPVTAAHVSAAEAIETLETLGLVQGTGSGFEPDRSATRAEAAVMLLRLLGQAEAAKSETEPCPFADGGWAAPYLSYAAKTGLVCGKSANWFGASEPVNARDFVTMALRALGYSEADGDFTWAQSLAFSDRIGLTHGEYTAGSAFVREDMALVAYTALTLPIRGSGERLIDQLYLDGVVSAAALKTTRLSSALSAGKPVYSAAEIYEQCSSAVLFVETYTSEEDYRNDVPTGRGSAFFITPDGVAVLSYHELDGISYARGTTTDGRRYELTGILSYDPMWDSAVVRFSRTDDRGNTVRFFPWLELGDSDTAYAGEPVFTVGAPLGVRDSVSSGTVSNRSYPMDDPAYCCILHSAPISTGSSGGPLLNAHGEVLGFIYGYFTEGQNMNIATPVSCISDVDLSAAGTPLRDVCAEMDEQKAAAEIYASRRDVTVVCGELAEVQITHTAPVPASLTARTEDPKVAICSWGEFSSKRSITLYIAGVTAGETEIEISFSEAGIGSDTETVSLCVTVVDPPEENNTDFNEE